MFINVKHQNSSPTSWSRRNLAILLVLALILLMNASLYALQVRRPINQVMLLRLLKNSNAKELAYQLIQTYPHAPLFTQGLFLDGGFLYESSGLYHHSKLQKLHLETNEVKQAHHLPPHYFAEGIVIMGDLLYQLTYQEQKAFIYNKKNLTLLKTIELPGEGWGLTSDGKHLIKSDGSAQLTFISPVDFKETHCLEVTINKRPIPWLNELEMIRGRIVANVWQTSIILFISPDSGQVDAWINIEDLKPKMRCSSSRCVANGIAYDADRDTLIVTGKFWPHYYRIKLLSQ